MVRTVFRGWASDRDSKVSIYEKNIIFLQSAASTPVPPNSNQKSRYLTCSGNDSLLTFYTTNSP